MARGRVEASDVGRVTVNAYELPVFVDGLQLFRNVKPLTVFVMALGASGNRHIWFQTSQRRRLGDVNVADGAFGRGEKMALVGSAAIMPKPH